MNSRELINAFIDDNFDRNNFDINIIDDLLAILTDNKGNKLSLIAVPSYKNDMDYVICTKINNVSHFDYRLSTDYYGNRVWIIL